MLLRHLTRLRHQARLAHLPDGQQQVVHLTCREVEILRLISQRVDDLELLVDVEGGVEDAVGGRGGDGPSHALVARRERVLEIESRMSSVLMSPLGSQSNHTNQS